MRKYDEVANWNRSKIGIVETSPTKRVFVQKKPIGIIGNCGTFYYGFDGDTYYVCDFMDLSVVNTCKMTFEQAKCLYDALVFNGECSINHRGIISFLKSSRKTIKRGKEYLDFLFWGFLDAF